MLFDLDFLELAEYLEGNSEAIEEIVSDSIWMQLFLIPATEDL